VASAFALETHVPAGRENDPEREDVLEMMRL
jgi:hypothetical protein